MPSWLERVEAREGWQQQQQDAGESGTAAARAEQAIEQAMRSRGLGRSRKRVLDLSRLEVLGPRNMELLAQGIARMNSLRKLALVCCTVRGEDMKQLCAGLATVPHLRELELARNRLLDLGATRLAKTLPQMSALEWLGLGENGIGKVGAQALGGGGYWLDGLNVGHGEGIQDMKSLTKLEMVKNRVGKLFRILISMRPVG